MTISTDTPVSSSLRALMTGIIDYAGLFPPAALALPEAITNFARYRQGADAWMLSRFVIPIRRLPELDAYASLFEANPVFRFSVLGTGGAEAGAFLEALRADMETIAAFHAQHGASVAADMMEVRFPADLLGTTSAEQLAFLEAAASHFPHDVFYEVPLNGALPNVLPSLLEALGAFNETQEVTLGLKLRMGGVEAAAFPAAQHVAEAIIACRNAGVPFKATAGLHHPVRHYNDSVHTRMHGFLNVFGGAALAQAHGLDADALRDLLLDESTLHFRVDADALHYRDLRIDTKTLAEARSSLAISFGSCSFDEPREDLQALGWL